MCTVSWTSVRNGYDLFFNRDELTTRGQELPPMRSQHGGVEFIAPRDGDHFGTWLLANEWGLTVCLLNDYGNAWRPADTAPRFSRGHIVLACAGAADHAAVVAAVRAQPLACARPFQLVAVSPNEGPLVLHWQGIQLLQRPIEAVAAPLTSSSFATDDVVAQRIGRFAAFVPLSLRAKPAELAAYHRQHAPDAGAHSVLMRRADASTRSISHVRVDGRQVQLSHESVGWSEHGPVMSDPTQVTLDRRQAVLAA